MQDKSVRPKIDDLIYNIETSRTKGRVIQNPTEEIIVSDGTTVVKTPKVTPASSVARGYAESRARLGETSSDPLVRSRISETPERTSDETIKVDKTKPSREHVESAVNSALEQERAKFSSAIKTSVSEDSPRSLVPGKPNPAPTGTVSVSSDAWDGVSDKQIIAMFGRGDKQQIVDILNSLPEERRNNIISAVMHSGSSKVRSALQELDIRPLRNSKSVKKIQKAHSERLSERLAQLTERRKPKPGKYSSRESRKASEAFSEAEEIAQNLVTLRESKNPMQTLRRLSSNERSGYQIAEHPEEFREALEHALKTYFKGKSGKEVNRYRHELDQLLAGRGIVMKNGGVINLNKINAFVYKHGGVLKGQEGLPELTYRDDIEPSIVTAYRIPRIKTFDTSRFNVALKPFTSYNDPFDNSLTSDDLDYINSLTNNNVKDAQDYVSVIDEQNRLLAEAQAKKDAADAELASANKSLDASRAKLATAKAARKARREQGYNTDLTRAKEFFYNTALSALDYGSMAWGRKKVHDQIEKGLKDSLYRKVTPLLHGISTATPIEDAAVARYDNYIQRGLTTPLTSDNVINTQNVLSLQGRALEGRDQAIRQQSTAALQRKLQNIEVQNEQAVKDAEAENDFRQRLAGLKMNLAQNDASLTAQTAQSIQNYARELREKFATEQEQYKNLGYQNDVTAKTAAADRSWLQHIQTNYKDLWDKWNEKDANGKDVVDKSKYGYDFNTWAQNTGQWTSEMESAYNTNRTQLNDDTLDLYKQWKFSPASNWVYRPVKYTGRDTIPSVKKGGKIGTNRYKNEPDEDIWINQNKATHKLVAKLNDNIIKTFLKTLK